MELKDFLRDVKPDDFLDKTTLFDGKMKVAFPKGFKDMPEELVAKRFLGKNKPHVILSNEDASVFYTFSLYANPLENKEKSVKEAITQIHSVIKKQFQAIPMPFVFDGKELKIGWFTYKTPSTAGALFQVMYVAPIAGQLMLGTCVCPDNSKNKLSLMSILSFIKDAS